MDGGRVLNPSLVGRLFIKHFYTVLHQAPHYAHRFFGNDSSFSFGEPGSEDKPVVGQENIKMAFEKLDLEGCRTKVIKIDCQHTLQDAVLIQVFGALSLRGGSPRPFFQTVVLAPISPTRYFALNFIFRYKDCVEKLPTVCLNDDLGLPKSPRVPSQKKEEVAGGDNLENVNQSLPDTDDQLRPCSPQEANVWNNPESPKEEDLSWDARVTKEMEQQAEESTWTLSPDSMMVIQDKKDLNGFRDSSRMIQNMQEKVYTNIQFETSYQKNSHLYKSSGGNLTTIETSLSSLPAEAQEKVLLRIEGEDTKSIHSIEVQTDQDLMPKVADAPRNESDNYPGPSTFFRSSRSEESNFNKEETLPGFEEKVYRNASKEEETYSTTKPLDSNQAGLGDREADSWNQRVEDAEAARAENGEMTIHCESPHGCENPADHSEEKSELPPTYASVVKKRPVTFRSFVATERPPSPPRRPPLPGPPAFSEAQVFVGNLTPSVTEGQLRDFFATFGPVLNVRLIRKSVFRNGTVLPNYGFVSFLDKETIKKVLEQKPLYLNNHRLNVEERSVRKDVVRRVC